MKGQGPNVTRTVGNAFRPYAGPVYLSTARTYAFRTGVTTGTITSSPTTFSSVNTGFVSSRYRDTLRSTFVNSTRRLAVARPVVPAVPLVRATAPATTPTAVAPVQQRPPRDPATQRPPRQDPGSAPGGTAGSELPRQEGRTFLEWLRLVALGAGVAWATDTMRNAFTEEEKLRTGVLAGLREIEKTHPRSAAAALAPELESWMEPVGIVFGSQNFASGSIGTYFSRSDTVELLGKAPTKANIASLVDSEYVYYLTQEWWPIAKAAGIVFTPELRTQIWHDAIRKFRDGLGEDDRAAFDSETNNEWRD